MRIWHVDTVGSPVTVDGVAVGLWLLAAAQARLGHDVTLFVRSEPDELAIDRAAGSGLRLRPMSRSLRTRSGSPLRRELRERRPDIVHFHAAWVPAHALLARRLRHAGVPYVVTPHGGYAPAVRCSKRRRRDVYVRMVERPYVRHAAAVLLNLTAEAAQVLELAGTADLPMATVPFPAAAVSAEPGWSPDVQRPTVLFLGRFDPYQKGLDRLVEIARHCPGLWFELCGTPPDASPAFEELRANAPANVDFRAAIHGAALDERIRTAALYVQPGRFDGFPLAVADALGRGLPCLVSTDLAVADELVGNDVGGTVPTDPAAAARAIRELLEDETTMRRWSANGPAFVRGRFDPDDSARDHVAVYTWALDGCAVRDVGRAPPVGGVSRPPSRR